MLYFGLFKVKKITEFLAVSSRHRHRPIQTGPRLVSKHDRVMINTSEKYIGWRLVPVPRGDRKKRCISKGDFWAEFSDVKKLQKCFFNMQLRNRPKILNITRLYTFYKRSRNLLTRKKIRQLFRQI